MRLLQDIPLGYYAFSGLVNFLTASVIASIVFFSSKKSKTNRIFAGFSFSVAYWSLLYFVWLITKNKEWAEFYLRSCMIGVLFMPSLFIHFVASFLNLKINKKFIAINYALSILFTSTIYTSLYAKDIGRHLVFPYWLHVGPVFHLALFHFGAVVLYSFYLMWQSIKKERGIFRNQILYVFIGTAIGYVSGVTNFFCWYRINIPPFLNVFVSLYVIMVAVAVLKYRLMDINVALTRTGIFSVVYLCVLGIPFWIGFRFLGKGAWIFPVSVMAVFATLGPFIYNYFRRRAEDIVLKDQHRYQETLRKLSATLTLVKELERLLKLVVLRVARAVKVDFACVYLANENKLIQKYPYTIKGFFPDFPKELSFDSNLIRYIISKRKPVFAEELVSMTDGFNLRSGLIVPSFVRKRLLGFLVLGPKSSGAIYTQEDANMFGILANQLALAIENSQFIDEHERTQAELFSRERMASLGTMAGGMTHQINNRFNAISMATSDTIDTLKFIDLEKATKEELKDHLNQIAHALNRIQENALRGGKLVNDFLNFSQPDRLQKEAKIFNLPEPLERGIEMVRIKTAFSQDTIQKEIPESPLLIRGSFEMIQDMYFNITDNAVDALDKKDKAIQKKELTPPESGYKARIVIRMYREGSFAVTKIQDNGIGMTKEQLEKLFTPFFTTKATAVKGTGFGLFVIYKIVEHHKGTIEVESEYGKGTTFTIKLPLAKEGE